MPPPPRPRVVVLGAGFAGLEVARGLRRAACDVLVIDRRNHHVFQPLLYQVATAALAPTEIAAPIRRLLKRQANATVLLGEVTAIDLDGRRVLLGEEAIPYDVLVVATGATHAYFGHAEWAPHAPGLKTLADALEIRRRVLGAFEAAEREPDPEVRRAWLTFVVIGGGATGVELAGALAEIARHTLPGEFRRIHPEEARVVLVEGQARVLPPFPPKLGEAAAQALVKKGVELELGAKVTGIDALGVTLGETRIAARTIVWAAGVAASPLGKLLGAPCDPAGRVLVGADLRVPGRPEVYVCGDLARLEQDGAMVPGVAPAALQEGRYLARAIRTRLGGGEPAPFRYFDKGTFAVIGKNAAVGQPFGKLPMTGFLAWMAWLFIHLLYVATFRNRVYVLFSWAWAYLTGGRAARLIPEPGDPTRH